ncbi:muts domain V-domain-containing protein [Radiomyces spectabilis]|uniref:muts domain V-domain-containing protein n=1 Tax=Radiomyces spectabilis TaxID=64574 RepID=UPI00221E4384|nr:muts domain V-domain-containing protein [Radiomyces spectabilis]KAI8365247.1 muts domain V-domain-containing protein [Radiomyces spectabilis]
MQRSLLPWHRHVSKTSYIYFSRRFLHGTSTQSKRVTHAHFNDIFPADNHHHTSTSSHEALQDSIHHTAHPASLLESCKTKEEIACEPLTPRHASTGSVVLDAVREYTRQYPLCVLLVQVGDFYELYDTHAARYASLLDLKLTRKEVASGVVVDFAGFPSRSLEKYLDMLVNHHQCRVALCEQYTVAPSPGPVVSAIRRRITRVITPGTVVEERFLDSHAYNYLLAVSPRRTNNALEPSSVGLAWVDLSIGEFVMQETQWLAFKDDIARINPREVILPESVKRLQSTIPDYQLLLQALQSDSNIAVTYQPDTTFDADTGRQTVAMLFRSNPLLASPDTTQLESEKESELFGDAEYAASNALLSYIGETHMDQKPKLQPPVRFAVEDTVRIDSAAMASLELVKSLKEGKRSDSLLGVINHTVTHAGARLLARWVASPLASLEAIEKRLDVVSFFHHDRYLLDDFRLLLKQSSDVQRALQRLALNRGQHTDLIEIGATLKAMFNVKNLLMDAWKNCDDAHRFVAVQDLMASLDSHDALASHIDKAFDSDRIANRDGKGQDYGYIHRDFSPKLKRCYKQLDWLHSQRETLQADLRSLCGNSLQLVNTGPLRHVVELNASRASKLLAQHSATLINKTKSKHRYHIEEWTELSLKIELTEASIMEIEQQVFKDTVADLLENSAGIMRSCRILAQLDALACFAYLAREYRFTRPTMTLENEIRIVDGRHPVVEANLAKNGRMFVKNDCTLAERQRLWLLTGPNMGGKSTFLRQNAIIVLLAHIGCFVPAKHATIGMVDRIFSRVGASDNLAQDQSTFMVEMVETATILNHATDRSLVIMDEVGRGTATADGFSLAYSILNYLHDHIGCRTLFATHYHELADAVARYDQIACFMTSLDEAHDDQGSFWFVHKVKPGVCRQSHGLKVARLAGLPSSVITLAEQTWRSIQQSDRLLKP